MALITWSGKYSVGVVALDDQHKGLFATLNDLHAAMMKGQAQSVTRPLLRRLLAYTEEHFAAEEALMTSAGYPQLAEHRLHHRNLTAQVKEFMARYEKGDATVNLELLEFLRNWLSGHIQTEDHKYGPWLHEHGVR